MKKSFRFFLTLTAVCMITGGFSESSYAAGLLLQENASLNNTGVYDTSEMPEALEDDPLPFSQNHNLFADDSSASGVFYSNEPSITYSNKPSVAFFSAEQNLNSSNYANAESNALFNADVASDLSIAQNGNYIHNDSFDGAKVRNGIDVSYYQKDIDWNAVKKSGVEFVFIRVGYRGYSGGTLHEDPKFASYIQGALAADLKVGVYFFSQAITRAEAVEEAQFTLKRLSGYNLSLPVVMDFEYAGGEDGGRLYQAGLSKEAATSVCSAFCDTIAVTEYSPMIYANKNMLENHIDGNTLGQKYKIWLAHYTNKSSYAGKYSFWQYTSSGAVSGIAGRVDLDFWYDNSNMVLVGTEDGRLYLTQLYEGLLGREPDADGLKTYLPLLTKGEYTASRMALQLISSKEFTDKKYSNEEIVAKVFQGLLNRTASDTEISHWATRLNNGMSNRYLLSQITGSAEFTNLCKKYNVARGQVSVIESRDRNYNYTAYVMNCYQQIFGRKADASGLNTWTRHLLNGSGGVDIIKDLLASKEFTSKQYDNEAIVEHIYLAMLGRSADPDGKAIWTNFLNRGVSISYILKNFVTSSEYKSLCKKYDMKTGSITLTESRDKNTVLTAFVSRCYRTGLSREPDADGLNYWCCLLLNKQMSPANVASNFASSKEATQKYATNDSYVEMLYHLCLNRNSDTAGKSYWVNLMANGHSRNAVFQNFANSVEFKNIVKGYGL